MQTLLTVMQLPALALLGAAVSGYGISLVEGVLNGRYKPRAKHRATRGQKTGN